MFPSSTIIRELALNLAKVIFMLGVSSSEKFPLDCCQYFYKLFSKVQLD